MAAPTPIQNNEPVDVMQLETVPEPVLPPEPAPAETPQDVVNAAAAATAESQTALEKEIARQTESINKQSADTTELSNMLRNELDPNAKSQARRLQEEQDRLGVIEGYKSLQNINNQIAQATAAYNAGIVQEEGRPIARQFITGRQAQLRLQQAAEIGALTAAAQAQQGNIALAEQIAARTVNAEFADREQRISTLQSIIELNYQNLTAAEKRRADLVLEQTKRENEQIEQEKADKAAIQQTMIDAAKNGADNDTLRAIMQSTTPLEAVVRAGSSLAQTDTKVIDLGFKKILVDQKGKVIQEFNESDPLLSLDIQKRGLEIQQLQQELGMGNYASVGSGTTVDNFLSSLSAQESGGSYTAQNGRTGAYGKFQIMPGNWNSWATEAGLPDGAEQTPENQELVTRFKVNQYYEKYGNWADVASVWYSGRPFSQVVAEGWADNKQGNGNEPSVREYVNSVLQRMEKQTVYLKPEDAKKLNAEILKTDQYKALEVAKSTLAKFNEYANYFNEVGNQRFGDEAAKLASLYRIALLDLKEFFNLGVLNGPDLDIMESLLLNPTGLFGQALRGGEKGIQESINAVGKMIDDRIEMLYNDINTVYSQYDASQVNALKSVQNAYNTAKEAARITVKDNESGQIGTIPRAEFDKKKYTTVE